MHEKIDTNLQYQAELFGYDETGSYELAVPNAVETKHGDTPKEENSRAVGSFALLHAYYAGQRMLGNELFVPTHL